MRQMPGLRTPVRIQITEVREEWLSDESIGEHFERLFVESITEVPHTSDATCVTLKDIPLDICQWPAKRKLWCRMEEER